MPNWYEDDLQISGPDVKKVMAKIGNPAGDDDQKVIDFNVAIPYPKKFIALDKKAEKHNKNKRPDEPYMKDGYNSGGYEWCIDNWGTKWNAVNVTDVEIDDEQATFTFDTAWSPPLPVIQAFSKMFPEHEFNIEYYEAGIGFCGQARYVAGEEIYDNCQDYRGNRGG